MPQIYDMEPTALLPLRRKACWGFFRPKNPTALAGFDPANLCTKGHTLTLDHRSLQHNRLLIWICIATLVTWIGTLLRYTYSAYLVLTEECVYFAVRTRSFKLKPGLKYAPSYVDGVVSWTASVIQGKLSLWMTCRASAVWSPASHRIGSSLVLGRYVWVLWWKKRSWDRSALEYFIFPPVTIIPSLFLCSFSSAWFFHQRE